MAREIVAFCDPCADRGESTPGITRRVDLGGGHREMEACDGCWKTLTVAELEEALERHGRQLTADDSHRKLRCPWCPMSLASERNLRDHVDTKHPERVASFASALIDRQRKPTPAGRVKLPRDQPAECPECGKVCSSPQGLGAHRRSHGIEGEAPSTMAAKRKKEAHQ